MASLSTGLACPYHQDPTPLHVSPSPFTFQRHVAAVDETRMRLSEAERRERMEQLARTMALLVHACSCNVKNNCTSTSCRKVGRAGLGSGST